MTTLFCIDLFVKTYKLKLITLPYCTFSLLKNSYSYYGISSNEYQQFTMGIQVHDTRIVVTDIV